MPSVTTLSCSLILAVCLFVAVESCFLRDCPVGGRKRSQSYSDVNVGQGHLCKSCFQERGICVASNICCVPKLGCVVGGSISLSCSKEDLSPEPCTIPGRSCGAEGTCTIAGVCCEGDSCTVSRECDED